MYGGRTQKEAKVVYLVDTEGTGTAQSHCRLRKHRS